MRAESRFGVPIKIWETFDFKKFSWSSFFKCFANIFPTGTFWWSSLQSLREKIKNLFFWEENKKDNFRISTHRRALEQITSTFGCPGLSSIPNVLLQFHLFFCIQKRKSKKKTWRNRSDFFLKFFLEEVAQVNGERIRNTFSKHVGGSCCCLDPFFWNTPLGRKKSSNFENTQEKHKIKITWRKSDSNLANFFSSQSFWEICSSTFGVFFFFFCKRWDENKGGGFLKDDGIQNFFFFFENHLFVFVSLKTLNLPCLQGSPPQTHSLRRHHPTTCRFLFQKVAKKTFDFCRKKTAFQKGSWYLFGRFLWLKNKLQKNRFFF